MFSQLIALLHRYGYHLLDEEKNGVFIRETERQIYIVTIGKAGAGLQAEIYEKLQKQVEFLAVTRYQKPVSTLHLLVTEDGMFDDHVMSMVDSLTNLWLIAGDTGRIYIFENQLQNFDGLYEYLSDGLRDAEKTGKKASFTITPVNMVIVGLNILVFLGIIILNKGYFAVYDTEIMLQMGAMSYDTVKAGGWYRLVTSLFLHFGLSHLINNMVLLIYVGCELESRIGSVRYLVLYLLSGIAGNVVSLVVTYLLTFVFPYYSYENIYVVSAGASGAIFGVIGALFVVLLKNHTKTENLTPQRLLFLVIITIYCGLTSEGVDNAAHIGGLFGGIIGGFLLSKISQYGKLE